MEAIEHDDDATALSLIAARQGLNETRGTRRTPVTAAIEGGTVPVLKALIAAGAPFDPKASLAEYIGLAVQSGRWDMFDFIRAYGADLKGRYIGQSLLQTLASGNSSGTIPDADRIAIALLDAGVDPHFCGAGSRVYPPFAPLAMAAMHPYHVSLVRTLLDHVSYSPAELDTALDRATNTGAVESILLLQAARASQHQPAPSVKVLCQVAGRYDMAAAIETLVNAGADVNAPLPKLGRTALHTAIARGDAAGVRLLLEHGADIAVLDADVSPQSCLDLAATRLKLGRENGMNDAPYPIYEAERDGHEQTGTAVSETLKTWLVQHPGAAARLTAAVQGLPSIKSTPQPTPEAAIKACIATSASHDVVAQRSLILLPVDVERRKRVLRNLQIAETPPLSDDDMRLICVTSFGTVAVAEVIMKMYWADGGIPGRSGSEDVTQFVPLAKRDGGWLLVLDFREGGGLTEQELKTIEPLMRKNNS